MSDARSGHDAPTYTPEDLERESGVVMWHPKVREMLSAGARAMRDLEKARATAGKLFEEHMPMIERVKTAEARVKELEAVMACADKVVNAATQLTVIDFDRSEKEHQMNDILWSTQTMVAINEYREIRAALQVKP